MNGFTIYGVISIISFLVRQFLLPNPFECFGDRAVIINWIAGPVILLISYALVGLVYKKGSNPALGSILFLVTFCLITGILWILGIFRFAWWWILLCVTVLIGLVIGFRFLIVKTSDDYYRYD